MGQMGNKNWAAGFCLHNADGAFISETSSKAALGEAQAVRVLAPLLRQGWQTTDHSNTGGKRNIALCFWDCYEYHHLDFRLWLTTCISV